MDATNNKTLAVVFVALLVGATFVAAVPVAAQTIANPTSAVDAGIDVSLTGTLYLRNDTVTVTNANGYVTVPEISNVTLPSAQQLRYNTSYDLTFINIALGNAPGSGYGYTGAGATTEVRLLAPDATTPATATLYPSGCGTGSSAVCNATFANFRFTQTGEWELQSSTGVTIARLFVYPSNDMTVAVSPSSMAYTDTASLFTITATNSTGPVNNGVVTSDAANYLGSSSTTNPSGVFQFFQAPPGAGTFNFYVSQNFGGTTVSGLEIPEVRGAGTLTVSALPLTFQAGNGTAFIGFSTPIAFRPLLSSGVNALAQTTAPASLNGYNISVVTPGNYMFIANTSDTPSSFSGTVNLLSVLTCHNLSATNGVCVNAPTPQTFRITNGEIQFAPGEDTQTANNVWAAGTYTFTVALNAAGALASAAEYTGTYSLAPATPAAVNLAFTTGNTTTLANTLDVLQAVSAAPGRYVLNLYINGSSETEHPACRDATACTNPGDDVSALAFRSNITLRGDLLPEWTVTNYVASTGLATISGVAPTRNGTIYIDVAWKNTTTTLTIPVYKGAVTTLNTNNLTVDTTATLQVTVTDAFGNPQPGATVQILRRHGGTVDITGTTTIVGTGANTSVGQNGLYEFTIRPNSIADYVVYTSIQNGANFSYANFSVIPASDLTVTLTPENTMAGLNTNFLLNVTNATGIGATTTSGQYRAYFLNATQRTSLLNNGTTAVINAGGLRELTYVNNSAFSANASIVLDAGDYSVWFCQSSAAIADCATATHDNRQNMPVVNVSQYNAVFNPSQIANNPDVQGATAINVRVSDRDGTPVNGTLTILNNSYLATGGSSVAITNGQGNITLTGTNAGIGSISWGFNPDEPAGVNASAAVARVNGTLEVTPGNLTFQPARVPILQSTLITVRLTNFTGAGLAGREIRVCGVSLVAAFGSTFPNTLNADNRTNCPALGVTEADGSTGIVVTPTSLSSLGVYINNSYTGRTIPVTAGALTVVVNPTAPQAGGNVTITVNQPGGTPSVGARILVTRDGSSLLDQSADANGQAVLSNLAAGNYTVTAIRTGFDNGTATFAIGQTNVTPNSTFELSNLVLPSQIAVGTPATVSVDVTNTGNASGTATAILLVNNAQRDTQTVTLGAGENQTVAYTFTPTVAGTYAVSVRIGSTTIGPQNIVVGSPTTTTPSATPTVTPTGTTPSATPTVTPTGTTPTGTTPTVTPTPTEPTVPGFEVLALFAALGVALLVLRRRS